MKIEDIKRLNYIYYSSFRKMVKFPHSLPVCYILFFARLFFFFFTRRYSYKKLKPVLFVGLTLNNRHALDPIKKKLDASSFTAWNNPHNDIPWARVYWKSMKYLPLFQKMYNSSSYDDKRLIRQFYFHFMVTVGFYEFYDQLLLSNPQLKLIVFANDHNLENRCLIELSKKYNIKTLYVQHASVTERFPPLDFTWSFLDGKESYDMYTKAGDVKGHVYLIGSPRFDAVVEEKKHRHSEFEVGIALNKQDDLNRAIDLCVFLRDKGVKNIIVRPHPAMKNFPFKQFLNLGIAVSSPLKESSFRFLSRISKLVANESSIHLDSALLDIPSTLYNFTENVILDWYSYIKNGLILECKNREEVFEFIKGDPHIPTSSVQYYCSSYNTELEGRIGEVVADFINLLMKGQEAKWYEKYSHKQVN